MVDSETCHWFLAGWAGEIGELLRVQPIWCSQLTEWHFVRFWDPTFTQKQICSSLALGRLPCHEAVICKVALSQRVNAMPTEKEKSAQPLRRANTDGKVQASKTVDRGRIPEPAPFDPWASDSEDDSNANVKVIKPAPRRKLPSSKGKSEGGTGLDVSSRPNPLLANQRSSRPTSRPQKSQGVQDSLDITTSPGDRASPWSSSRSPSRPNPLLPSSRSPSVSRQVTDASMTPRARDRAGSRKRTDGSPRTPETTDPSVYLQSLLQETPTTTATDNSSPPASPPTPPTGLRTEMRHKGVARSLSRLYAEESKASVPKVRATQMPQQEAPAKKRTEEKPRGRSQPTRRTEMKAASEAAGGGLPVGTAVKARKTTTSKARKAPHKATEAEEMKDRPKPKMLGHAQESHVMIDEADLLSSHAKSMDVTTFDELSFTNEPPKVIELPPKSLEVPLPSVEQRAAFGQKVYSFGLQDELDICHKLDRGFSALQDAVPAVPAPPNPYDFQKPLKGKLNGDGKVLKDGQSSRTPNTHVQFPRLVELLKSGKGVDRSQRPVPEYGALVCLLQAQMVLGHSWTSDASMTSIVLHLVQWFLPYIVLLGVLLVVAFATLGPSEAFLVFLPLPLLLPLQQLRCRAWNRQLLGAVDKAAFADAFDQLRAPLGWGEDGQVFSANLNAAMHALSLPPGELLTSMQSRFHWKLYLLCTLVMVLPGVLFIVKNEGQNLQAAEVSALLLCVFALLLACAPGKEMRRSELVDQRLEALEAAFNALLDTLRPLLGPAAPPSVHGKAFQSSGGVERFSVRMVTSERFTLRGTLTIYQEECSLQISCPLASFNLVVSGLEGAVQTELGRCAAGEVDSMTLSPPRAQGSWATTLGMRFTRQSPERTRRDDDLASVSTASTLTRGKNQVDEASLHLALAMVTALSRRQAEPLEVFFAKKTLMAPPKAAYDEPAIVLSLAEDQLTCQAGFGAFGPEMSSQGRGCFTQRAPITKERFGVVRDPSEMRDLCTDESAAANLNSCESPCSYAASQGSDSEVEGNAAYKWPSSTRSNGRYAKLFSSAPRHLALVFDSFAARDKCLEVIRETLPLPMPAGRTKCFPAESWGHGADVPWWPRSDLVSLSWNERILWSVIQSVRKDWCLSLTLRLWMSTPCLSMAYCVLSFFLHSMFFTGCGDCSAGRVSPAFNPVVLGKQFVAPNHQWPENVELDVSANQIRFDSQCGKRWNIDDAKSQQALQGAHMHGSGKSLTWKNLCVLFAGWFMVAQR